MDKISTKVGKSLNSMKNTIMKESSVKPSANLSANPINSIINNTPSIGSPVNTNVKNPVEITQSSISNSANSIKSIASEQAEKSQGFISNIFEFKSYIFWILLIIALAFLGFNIFTYLSKGTDALTDILQPVTNFLGNLTGETSKTTINDTSSGTQKIIDKVSETSKSIVDNTSKGTTTGINSIQSSLKKDKTIVDPENNDKLTSNSKNSEPESIHTNSIQSGYCYIGKINDTRYCAKVDSKSKCMSGDIYPSMDICINPNLRN